MKDEKLRDELAMAALPAIIAMSAHDVPSDENWRVGYCFDAYQWADAMLIARSARVANEEK